ncbi:MAG: hypothetical protein EP330_17965 [Deltaproteobacteria bacterium]|nr:MAG: hypothetical protein EP330_17965 [Deltaproteobacteria bacterium]
MTDAAPSFHGTERYELRRCLGKGGFGVVWEAFDRDQEQRVALKTLREMRADALVSFKSEFRRLTGFVHPNLVRLYELTEADGTWFFTMELVDGVPFKGWVRPGHRSVEESTFNLSLDTREVMVSTGDTGEPQRAVRFPSESPTLGVLDEGRLRDAFAQLVTGVSAMHAEGMVHRDIKPSNVLVSSLGRVVLLDFGLAAELAARRTGRETLRIGTPAYMPPEVASGGQHGEAGDWYSVGVVLFEALTGSVPFRGSPRAVLRSKAAMDAPDPVPMVPDNLRDLAFLARDLLARDPASRPTGDEIRHRLGIGAPVSSLGEGAFVGRESQLDDLNRLLARARDGECAVALVTGPSGIGKSALVRHFVDGLGGDEVVLQGSCYERESVPFKALDELIDDLGSWLSALPRRERKRLLPQDAGELTRLFPALQTWMPAPEEAVADLVEVRRRAAEALFHLLERIAEGRLIVLEIDDVQWGDADSAAVLELILQRDAARVLLLVTCRENGLDQEVPALLRRMIERGAVVGGHIEVGQLSPDESAQLATSLLGEDDERIARLVAEADGHPLFLDGLVRYAHEGAAGSLDEMIAGHVGTLPEDAVRVLRLVSVAPQPVPRRLIRRASRLRGDQAATSQLVVDRLVHTVGTSDEELLAPYHSRIREAVLGTLDELSLRIAHRDLADAMEELGWGEVEHLFMHRKGAGEKERARELALRAAGHAESAYAFHRAAELYAEARALGATGWGLSAKEGAAWIAAGRPEAAADALLRASESAPENEARDLRRRAAEQLLAGGHADRGIELTREVLEPLDLRLASSPRWALASLLAQRAALRLRGLEPAREHQPTADELYKVDTCWSLASGLAIIDTFVATDFQVRQLRLALDAGEPYRVVRALALEASYLAAQGHDSREAALSLLERAEAMAEDLDSAHLRAFLPLCRAMCDFLDARWKESASGMLIAERILERECRDVTWELSQTTTFYVDAVHNLGQMSLLKDVVPPRLAAARARGNKQLVTYLQYIHASMVRLATDEPERGLEEISELDHRSPYGFHYTDWWRMYGTANIQLYRGRAGEALEAWERDWPGLKGSMFLLVEVIGQPAHYHRSMLNVAVAAEMPEGLARTHKLCVAERTARWLTRRSAPWGQAAGLLLHALIASARGNEQAALDFYTEAERRHEELDMALLAFTCRYRRGEILQGDEGEGRRTESLAGIRELGCKAPGRMIDFYAPVRIR